MNIKITKIESFFCQNEMHSKQEQQIQSKRQTGFSFIEVIVAALILSTSILGVAGLQILSMKGTQQSAMKSQAMGVIQNLAERMRTNYQGVVDGDYKLADSASIDCTKAPPAVCSAVACTSTKVAKLDLYNLVCGYGTAPRTGGIKLTTSGDLATLVNGKLQVSCPLGSCVAGEVTMRVEWVESTFGEEVAGPADSLVLSTRITAP